MGHFDPTWANPMIDSTIAAIPLTAAVIALPAIALCKHFSRPVVVVVTITGLLQLIAVNHPARIDI
jgi:hypothetical protein